MKLQLSSSDVTTLLHALRCEHEGCCRQRLAEKVQAQIKPSEVFEHYVESLSDEVVRAVCGKVWKPAEHATVVGRCPACKAAVEGGWQA